MEGKKRTRRFGGRRANTSGPKMRKSCDACALAKRKCDGKTDCSLCVKRGSPCIYSERQKSGPKGCKGSGESGEDSTTTVDPPTDRVASSTKPVRAAPNGPQRKRARKVPLSSHQPPKGDLPLSRPRTVTTHSTNAKPATAPTTAAAGPSRPTTKGGKAPRSLQPKTAAAAGAAAAPYQRPAVVSPASPTQPSTPSPPLRRPAKQRPKAVEVENSLAQIALPPVAAAVCRSPIGVGVGGRRAGAPSSVVSIEEAIPAAAVARSEASSMAGSSASGWDDVTENFVASPEEEMLWSCDDFSDLDSSGGGRERNLVGFGGSSGGGDELDNSFRGSVFISDAFAAHASAADNRKAQPMGSVYSHRGMVEQRQQRQQQQQQQHLQRHRVTAAQGRPSSPSVVSRHSRTGGVFEYKSSLVMNGGAEGFSRGGAYRGGAELLHASSGGGDIGVVGGHNSGGIGSPISTWTQEAVDANTSTLLAVLADTDVAQPSPSRSRGDEECVGGGRRFFWPPQYSATEGVSAGANTAVMANGRLPTISTTTSGAVNPRSGPSNVNTVQQQQQQQQREPSVCESWMLGDTMSLNESPWLLAAHKGHLASFCKVGTIV